MSTPVKPPNCTCSYPALIARNMCGHGTDPQGNDCPVLVQFHLDLEEGRRQAAWEAEKARHSCPNCHRADMRSRIGAADNCTRYECGRCGIEFTVFDRHFYEHHELPLPETTWKPSSRLASNDIPRRHYKQKWTHAEVVIKEAVEAVEAAGCHPLLTEAVNLLQQAFGKVADHTDQQRLNDPSAPAGTSMATFGELAIGEEFQWKGDPYQGLHRKWGPTGYQCLRSGAPYSHARPDDPVVRCQDVCEEYQTTLERVEGLLAAAKVPKEVCIGTDSVADRVEWALTRLHNLETQVQARKDRDTSRSFYGSHRDDWP